MPTTARTHGDMLHVCCGICGQKKSPDKLRKITDNILTKIKTIKGYEHYDINDDRYPKVICGECIFPVNERFTNPSSSSFKNKLPVCIPPFADIIVPNVTDINIALSNNEDHMCFLCDQNNVGRPKKQKDPDQNQKTCSKCHQKTGRGISHKCVTLARQSVSEITNAIQELNQKIQDKVLYSLLQSKLDTNEGSKEKVIKLHTGGKVATVELNPPSNRAKSAISTGTLDKIRNQASLSLN